MKAEIIGEDWKGTWDSLVANSPEGSFLQSFEWGEFKKALGKKVFRLAVFKTVTQSHAPLEGSTKVLALGQLIKEEVFGFGSFLYAPHAPIFLGQGEEKERIFEILKEKALEIARKEKAFCVRFEPKESLDFAPNLKHYRSSIQALYTLKVDLKPSLEEIMASFKQKTRYNVKLAERRGVKVRVGGPKDLDTFVELLRITAQRDKFAIYEEDYYRLLYRQLAPEKMAELLVAEYQGKVLGVFLNIFFGPEATYLHGATSNEHRNLMPSYALMWTTIQRAKERGCKALDLWGVAPENDINHPWYGFTRFKRGFAPKASIIAYPGSYFAVLNPLKFQLYIWQKVLRGKRI